MSNKAHLKRQAESQYSLNFPDWITMLGFIVSLGFLIISFINFTILKP